MNWKQEIYETPIMEKVSYDNQDVITLSGYDNLDIGSENEDGEKWGGLF